MSRPLYYRLLQLNHIRPRGPVTFAFFEGSIAVAALLALAEIVNWWGLLAIPLTVALMVKLNDIVAGATAAPLAFGAAGIVGSPARGRTALGDAIADLTTPPAGVHARVRGIARGVAPVKTSIAEPAKTPHARRGRHFPPGNADAGELVHNMNRPDVPDRRNRANQCRFQS
jgi:hypothetical protein